MRPDGIGLEDHPQAPPLGLQIDVAPGRENHLVLDRDLALVGILQPRDASQGGRFAAAAGAEQHRYRAFLERHIQPFDNADLAETLAQAADGNAHVVLPNCR